MYPMTPVSVADLHAQPRFADRSRSTTSRGARAIYEPRNEFEERYAYYPAQTVENIRNDVTLGALKGAAVQARRDARRAQVDHLRQRRVHEHGAGAVERSGRRDAGHRQPQPQRRASTGRTDPRAESQKFFDSADLTEPAARGRSTSSTATTRRSTRSIRAAWRRSSTTSTRASACRPIATTSNAVDRHAARARRQHRRPRHRQPQRSRRGHEADHARRERLLPARLHLDGGADRRQVPHDRRPREAARRRGPRAQGLLGLHRGGRRRARRAPPKPGPPPEISHALNAIAEPASSGHAARFWTGTDRRPTASRACTFVWEPLRRRRRQRAPTDVAARVMLTATAPTGGPVFRGPVGEPAPRGRAAPAPRRGGRAPPPARACRFTAPPGPIELRIVVENARGQVIDSTTQSLTVPDYAKTPVVVRHAARLSRAHRARDAAGAQQPRRDADRRRASSAAASGC